MCLGFLVRIARFKSGGPHVNGKNREASGQLGIIIGTTGVARYMLTGKLFPTQTTGMSRLQYVIVAAGAVKARTDGRNSHGDLQATIQPGDFVFVKASSQAYWRGSPVPEVVPVDPKNPGAPPGTTLLGVLARMPVASGSNFGVPLAVLTVVIQGPCELLADAVQALPFSNPNAAGWRTCGGRRLLYTGVGSSTPSRIVLL